MKKDILIQDLPAYHSYLDDGKTHAGLIIIHEIWGLDAHMKNVADRFAAQGYSVIAPNLFHGMSFEGKVDEKLISEMQNPATRDEAQKKMRELTAPMRSPEFAQDIITKLKKCVDYLVNHQSANGKVGVIGFCFGGTYSFHLAASDPRINIAVPFYGQPPTEEEIPNIQCPILAFYGEQDTNLIESLPKLKEDMNRLGKQFEAVVYPDTGHAFFNDTNRNRYNAFAAQDAWGKTLSFLKMTLL